MIRIIEPPIIIGDMLRPSEYYVRIDPEDGQVYFGPRYNADEASSAFWVYLGYDSPVMLKEKIIKLDGQIHTLEKQMCEMTSVLEICGDLIHDLRNLPVNEDDEDSDYAKGHNNALDMMSKIIENHGERIKRPEDEQQ